MPKTAGGKAVLGIASIALAPITGGASTFLYTLGANMILAGVSQRMQDKRLRPEPEKSSIKFNFNGEENPLYLVFGQMRVGGHISVMGVSGTNNKYLHIGVTHSAAPPAGMSDITDIWLDERKIDDTEISEGPGGTYGDVSGNTYYDGIVRIARYLGTDSETADSDFDANIPSQDSSSTGKGLARTHVRFEKVEDDEAFHDAFPRGIPQLTALVEGRCYDCRLDSTNGGTGSHRTDDPDTWEFSQNTFVIASTYAIMDVLDGGCGFDPDTIDWTVAAASANRCDDTVTRPDNVGGTVLAPRHTCNIVLDTGDGCLENMTRILSSADGVMCTGLDGKIKFFAGEYDTPTTTIDASWLREGEYITDLDRDDNDIWNAVRSRYIEPLTGYQTIASVPYENSTYATADGRQEWKDLELPATIDRYEAQYLNTIEGRKSRHQKTLILPLNWKGHDIEIWENVTLDLPELNAEGVFKVVNWKDDPRGPVVTFLEQQEDTWDSSIGIYTEIVPDVPPALVQEVPPTPSGLTVSSVINGNALAWDPLGAGEYAQILVYRATSEGGTYTNIADVRGNTYTDPVTDDTTYYYKIQATSPIKGGARSEFSSIVNSKARLLHTNLIRNPSGALGTRFWNNFGGATVASLLGPDGYQVRFTGASSGTRGIYTDIDARPNVAYSLSGEVFAAGLNSGNVVFDVLWLDSGDSQIGSPQSVTIISTATGWKYYTLNGVTSPTGTAKARVRIWQSNANVSSVIAGRKLKLEEGEYATLFSDEASQEGNRLTVANSGVQLGDQRMALAIVSGNLRNNLVTVAVGSSILQGRDGGLSATMRLKACTIQYGFGQVSYNQSDRTGLNFDETYYGYALDASLAGGTVTLLATQTKYVPQSNQNYVYFGFVKMPVDGGSETDGGGGAYCVAADAWLNEATQAREAKAGQVVTCWDGGDAFLHPIREVYPAQAVPCVRITTESGAVITCSMDTPITQPDGRSVLAANIIGGKVLTEQDDGSFAWESVTREWIGEREVTPISVGGISFAASDVRGGRRIITHNIDKDPIND